MGVSPRPTGDLHLGLDRSDPAIAHLLRARTLQPDEMEYALMLGRALRLGQRPLAAQYHLFDALDSLHHRVDACLDRSSLDGGLHWRTAEARAYAQIALRFAPLREEIRELLTRLADATWLLYALLMYLHIDSLIALGSSPR